MIIPKEDLFTIILTFVIGLLAGGYLYLTVAAGYVSEFEVPDAEKAMQLSIIGDTYGGCSLTNSCASFLVLSDASFKYQYTPTNGGAPQVLEGEIPSSLRNRLARALVTEELERQSMVIEPDICQSYVDGIDVVYEITLDRNSYILDSCGTAVDTSSELWQALAAIWTSFTQ